MRFNRKSAGSAVLLPATLLAAALYTGLQARPQPSPAAPPAAAPAAIPQHPRNLVYPELKFEVPKADRYRVRLKNGIVAYVAEDHSLPLVNISVTLRAGAFLDPGGKTGLAALTGEMLRDGGTGRL